jgi:UDPglucose--hexose-1-phosphate uridylyltransferase
MELPELRKDPITGRWVIISTERGKRPNDFLRESVVVREPKNCPFCAGNESKTPPEVLVYGRNGGGANTPGWKLRVVPNRFPALGIEGELDREGEGLFDKMNGIGAHEVIIESPDHAASLATLPERAVEDVLWGYRDRMLDLKNDKRFRYILIFKNHGEAAGATVEHPHSQLIALPIVPRRVREEVDNCWHYYDEKERCIFCDIVRQERDTGERVIGENVAAAESAQLVVRKQSEFDLCQPGQNVQRHTDAAGRSAGPAGVQLYDPHLADRGGNQRSLSLAH